MVAVSNPTTVGAAQGEVIGMLRRALDWAARWRDAHVDDARPSGIRERDLVALGLVAQIVGARLLLCTAPERAADLARSLSSCDWLTAEAWRSDAGGAEPVVILAEIVGLSDTDLEAWAASGAIVLVLGEMGALSLPAIALRIRPLATINPALWCSDLALVIPIADQGARREIEPTVADTLASRLDALLGDQGLDPLALYEEVYRLRGAARSPTRADQSDQDLIALRRTVRGLVERAAIAERRAAARDASAGPVDWAAAFRVPPELDVLGSDVPSETELRARRARMEAEYLRSHIPAPTSIEEIDPRDLIAASGFFDIAWYADTYDVRPGEAIGHYLETGYREDKDPSPLFSGRDYVEANADVRAHGLNPLVHYLKYGIFEGRPTLPKGELSEAIWRDGFET